MSALVALVLYVAVLLFTRHLQRLERGRPRPFDISPLFVVLLYGLEVSQGSQGWYYGLAGLFFAGRIVQASAIDRRTPLRRSFAGSALSWLALIIVVGALLIHGFLG